GRAPALLRVLFLGYAWLPIALALYIAQSLVYALDGDFVLGRAPAHALFIGFFGSLLVAMVTRVTQGHSGRPLVFGGVAMFAFVVIQLVSVARIAAELVSDQVAWQAAAAAAPAAALGRRVPAGLGPDKGDAHECKAIGSMIESCPQIKLAHGFLAVCSGAIFALRGAGVLAGMRWPHRTPIRWTSYTVD